MRRRAGKQEIWPRKNYIFGVDGGNKLVHALFFTYLSFSIFCITMLFALFRAQTCGLKATGSKSKTSCLKFYWPFRLRHAQNSTSRFDFGAGVEKLFYLLLVHYIYIQLHTYEYTHGRYAKSSDPPRSCCVQTWRRCKAGCPPWTWSRWCPGAVGPFQWTPWKTRGNFMKFKRFLGPKIWIWEIFLAQNWGFEIFWWKFADLRDFSGKKHRIQEILGP